MRRQTIDHVFITRFNVPSPGREGLIRAKDGWLRDRVRLFEQFCVPAVEAQTRQDFHWLIYFDPDSPPWFMEWLEKGKSSQRFTAVFRTSVSRKDLISDLAEITGAGADVLLTTNLDNDDGLAVDFVQRLQQSVSSPTRTAIYFSQGIILSGTSTYLRLDPHNAFCSVAEPWEGPVTAWADWHNRLGLSMAVQELSGAPAWLQIIHARNVSNTVHGRLCNPASFIPLFPYALAGAEKPGRRTLFVDTLVLSPLRHIRERLRSAVKNFIIGRFGTARLDTVKNSVASVSGLLISKFGRANN